MNNPNYAYLAGALRSALENIAFDEKFFKIEKIEDRLKYLQKIAESANQSAIDYENEFKKILARAA